MGSIGRAAEVDSPRKENRKNYTGIDEIRKGSGYTMCVVEGEKGKRVPRDRVRPRQSDS